MLHGMKRLVAAVALLLATACFDVEEGAISDCLEGCTAEFTPCMAAAAQCLEGCEVLQQEVDQVECQVACVLDAADCQAALGDCLTRCSEIVEEEL